MVVLTSTLEERRRRSRNIVFAAFILLITIWSLKLAYPQHTVISVYQNHNPPPQPTAAPSSAPKSTNANADKWKTQTAEVPSMPETFNGTVTNKAAIIVEPQFRANLIPLILHFSSVLGRSWPILIYTSAESVGLFASSAALARYLQAGNIQVRILPQTVLLTNSDSVNDFMTQTWLWESLAPAEHILIFHSDSMLCSNAARSVDDFFEYDLVGSAMTKGAAKGNNGGLSLRRRSTILKILEDWSWEDTKKDAEKTEEQWYLNRMKRMEEEQKSAGMEPEEPGAINLPSLEVARTFSVASIDYPHPLGVHQVHHWVKDQLSGLDEWCPEYKLCSEGRIKD